VICVVVNAAQTEAVLFGENGVAASMPEGTVFISLGTMDPAACRRLESAGRLYRHAPISGGAAGAADGTLTVLASGPRAAFAKARPVLDAMAAKVHDLGAEVASARRSR
jgi:putative dehydrogenase